VKVMSPAYEDRAETSSAYFVCGKYDAESDAYLPHTKIKDANHPTNAVVVLA
jgi:hypothetical protein